MPTKAYKRPRQSIIHRLLGKSTAAKHSVDDQTSSHNPSTSTGMQSDEIRLHADTRRSTKPWTSHSKEIAWAERSFFQQQPSVSWHPEMGEGWGSGIYRRVMKDDQIRALLGLKQAVITSRSWRFETNTDEQKIAADFFHTMMEKHLCGSFHQAMGDILTSHVFGFSLLEKTFQSVIWQGQYRWSLRSLKLRPAETFRFEVDKYGNTTKLIQQQGVKEVQLPLRRFIHHVNKPEENLQYGESDLRECYRHWWAKENIFKFWNIYLERMASGFVHGRISGAISSQDRESLKQAMQNLSGRTSIITPANVELEMINAPSTDAFERAIAARDKAIAKALLVPNLLGFSEQGQTGGYSQSRIQLETFFFVLNGIAESVADVLNEQLFRELSWWNFGLVEYPRFSFAPLTEQQRQDTVARWKDAVTSGLVTPSTEDESRIRELLGFPLSTNGTYPPNQQSGVRANGQLRPDPDTPNNRANGIKPHPSMV